MNISEAKAEIKRAAAAYCARGADGRPLVPPERRRPVLLMGPPGIGKTAVVEQAARELGIGFAAYTLTHHTRQSAVGLPEITRRKYMGQEFTVTEYTMSEMIASVWRQMDETGRREGILFIDEINCVSETLRPTMLQFLQCKTFGTHRVPDGWMIAAAGNPREHNRAARDFDIVTLDRVKLIEIEPDIASWRAYAASAGVHPCVMSYLAIKPENFYRAESSASSVSFATARGWEDLSAILLAYEASGADVEDALFGQYIRAGDIAADFAVFYGIFRRVAGARDIAGLLAGGAGAEEAAASARAARPDERVAIAGLIVAALGAVLEKWLDLREFNSRLRPAAERLAAASGGHEGRAALIASREEALALAERHGATTGEASDAERRVIAELRAYAARAEEMNGGDASAEIARAAEEAAAREEAAAQAASAALERAYSFAEAAFGGGPELDYMTEDISRNRAAARFIAERGCEPYERAARELSDGRSREAILREIEALEREEL